jgi:hypothetical protein
MKIYNIVIICNLFTHINSFGFNFHTFLGRTFDDYLQQQNETLYNQVKSELNGMTFENISTWADKIKTNPKYRWTRNLHYIDIEQCGKIVDPERYCKNGCIYTTLNYLSTHNYVNLTVYENIGLLVHLLQDIFQPLHACGFYRGGNDKSIILKRKNINSKGRKINYHQLFDSFLPEYFVKNIGYSIQNQKNIVDYKKILQNNLDLCCKINWNATEIYLENFYDWIGGNNYYNKLIDDYLQLTTIIIIQKFTE